MNKRFCSSCYSHIQTNKMCWTESFWVFWSSRISNGIGSEKQKRWNQTHTICENKKTTTTSPKCIGRKSCWCRWQIRQFLIVLFIMRARSHEHHLNRVCMCVCVCESVFCSSFECVENWRFSHLIQLSQCLSFEHSQRVRGKCVERVWWYHKFIQVKHLH